MPKNRTQGIQKLKSLAALFLLVFISCRCIVNAQNSGAFDNKLLSQPLLFMQNNGQVSDAAGQPRPDVLYTASTNGVKLFLTATGIHYQFTKIEGINNDDPHSQLLKNEILKNQTIKTHHFSVELAGANPNPVILNGREANYTENYYLAHCPNGITGIHGFEKIIYQNVYPNIDWVLYSKDGFMEYDFLVHPGGDPASIRLKIKDAGSVGITPEGGLLMKTGLGEVKEKAPVSFAGGKKVDTRPKQNNDGTIGFDVAKHNGEELIIDPVVSWATYYGGSKSDRGFATTTDGEGNVYLVGDTYSKAGIASGGFNNTYIYRFGL